MVPEKVHHYRLDQVFPLIPLLRFVGASRVKSGNSGYHLKGAYATATLVLPKHIDDTSTSVQSIQIRSEPSFDFFEEGSLFRLNKLVQWTASFLVVFLWEKLGGRVECENELIAVSREKGENQNERK